MRRRSLQRQPPAVSTLSALSDAEEERRLLRYLRAGSRASQGPGFFDQAENIAIHTGKGIEFLDKYSALLRDRCSIEAEYAKNLRALAKKYAPKKKERLEEEQEFSYEKAFRGVLAELQDMAGQHEVISETYRERVIRDINDTARDLKDQRKKHLSEAGRLQQQLDATVEAMLRSQKSYQKAFKEAEASHLKYTKAEGNMDLSRAELAKAQQNAIAKAQLQEEAKNAYAHQLQLTNELQRRHFSNDLPTVLENLRLMDEGRIAYVQRLVTQCVEVERSVLPIIQRCLEGMLAHAQSIQPPADSKLVLDRYLSGYAPRQDFPFEDYGSPQASSSADTASLHSNNNGSTPNMVRGNKDRKSGGVMRHPSRSDKSRSKSVVDKLFGGKHRGGPDDLSEDCSELPPSQRCKRLRERIAALEADIDTKTKAKDGLTRLAQCYTEQPHMGNLDEVKHSLADTNRQLDHLTQELAKFKVFLEEADSQLNVPVNVALNGGRSPSTSVVSNGASSSPGKPHRKVAEGVQAPVPLRTLSWPWRSSLSEESVSSESSLGLRGRLGPAVPSPAVPASARSLHSQAPRAPPIAAPEAMGFADDGGGSSGEYNEAEEPEPVLGTANVLYPFEGGSEGTMAVAEGEEVLLIERDEGDGWTRIRKLRSSDEGFVPSSYLDAKWYPS